MAYRREAEFDASRDFKCATFFVADGTAYERNAPFPKDAVNARTLRLLYENYKIVYTDARADEEAAFLAPAVLTELGGGWWAVAVPWVDEPEKIQGRDKAVLRAQELRDAGEPLDHHGVVIIPGDGGWFTINAGWLREPEKVQDEEAATARATELRKAGPPEGWTDPDTVVLGSDSFDPSYQIGGETIQLGTIVDGALTASGQDRRVWNAMPVEQRDSLIKDELDRRVKAAADGAGDGAAAGPENPPAAPSKDDRVQALVDNHTENQLRDRIDEIDAQGAQQDPPLDPLGAKSDHTKSDLAGLIVEAGGDVAAEGEGGGGAA